jgi:peptidoglycan/xylan/chitin deacetylase (PgdA/CDA1 family)
VSGRVTVLAYHAIADLAGDPALGRYAVPPAEFERQLDALERLRYRFVGLDDVVAGVRDERPLPKRGLLLTFDDGYADLLTTVAPVLRERGVPAVAFVVAGALGATNGWDARAGARTMRLLSARELGSLSGFEIGAHTRTHADLTRLGDEDLGCEVSRAHLAAAGLPVPRAFSYPYGRVDARTVGAVRSAGYAVGFTLCPATVRAGADPLRLPRVEIHRGDVGARLALKLAAVTCIRPYLLGRIARWKRQRPRAPAAGSCWPGRSARWWR